MKVDWASFFPPGARVLALPSWRSPRLYLSARSPMKRWEQSSLYPASRMRGRLYRLSLRLGAAAGMTKARTVRSNVWPVGEFVQDALPQSACVTVLVGTPGPTQAITAQLRNGNGEVLGYLKYAKTQTSRERLRQERLMLSHLPDGIGPKPIKFGALGDGEALLQSPVPGQRLPATLPPPRDPTGLLDSLVLGPPLPLDLHPWVRRVRDRETSGLDAWLEPLSGGAWPVAMGHGDFAPWNLLEVPDGTLRAIDWEYGSLEGFPYLDLAYYVLQTSALVRRWSPAKATRYAVGYLSRHPNLALDEAAARSLVYLSAYDAYRSSSEDGQPPDARLQAWRRAVWERG